VCVCVCVSMCVCAVCSGPCLLMHAWGALFVCAQVLTAIKSEGRVVCDRIVELHWPHEWARRQKLGLTAEQRDAQHVEAAKAHGQAAPAPAEAPANGTAT